MKHSVTDEATQPEAAALLQELGRYRSLVENAVEGIFRTTPDGRYLVANPMLARIYGYESPAELMARLTDIEHQLYVDPGRRALFMRLLQENDAVWGFESQIYRKDGSVIWISECARAVYDAEDRLVGYEGTVEDIQRRKQAETEREMALREREVAFMQLQRARDELETRVRERTAALAETNDALQSEIAERRRAELDLEATLHELATVAAEKKQFYREVIRCVTRDRFQLVDRTEIVAEGERIGEGSLETFRDEPVFRRALRDAAGGMGMPSEILYDLELASGEAATNAIKHGVNGQYALYRTPDRMIVHISDHGAGIRAEDLPASLLQPGFSKAISLGMGYTLMLELADRVFLATDTEGTIVQLEKWLRPEERPQPPVFVAAWEQL